MRAFLWGRKMPLPNILEFIGTNITQRKFQEAQEKLLNYLGIEVPTKTELSNVSADLNAKIIPKADKTYVDNALSGFTNGASKFYPTLALAEADIANITVKEKVDIGEVANGGTWYKATTGATSLTKSPYDPLTQANAAEVNAKTYTDSKFDVDWQLYDATKNVAGRYVQGATNQVLSNAAWTLTIFPVVAGKTYAVKSSNFGSGFSVVLRDSYNTDAGAALNAVTMVATSDPTVKTFTVAADSTAKYALMNVYSSSTGFDIRTGLFINVGSTILTEPKINKVAGAKVISPVSLEELAYISESELTKDFQLYIAANNVANKFVSVGGDITQSTGTMLTVFPVTAGKTYALKASNYAVSAFFMALRDSNSTDTGKTLGRVSFVDTSDPTVKLFTIASDSTATHAFLNVVLPSQSYDIRNGLIIREGTIAEDTLVKSILGFALMDSRARTDILELQKNLSKVPLYGKKWALIGDSITEYNYRATVNYSMYIKNKVGSLTLYNYGQSGTGYFDSHNIANSITQTDMDFITVALGTNDFGKATLPLGAFLDTGTTTVSGCINTLLSSLITKFYNKKIYVFTPVPRLSSYGLNGATNAQGYSLEQLSELIKQYCRHYSLPCLDLYHGSNLPVWTAGGNTYYFTAPNYPSPDGLHPNDAGHAVMAQKIQPFLESNVSVR